MIREIAHPTHRGLSAYVVPFVKDGEERLFWLGTDLGWHETVAASKGMTLEDHLYQMVLEYFPGVAIGDGLSHNGGRQC